ncbi:MAG: hypothetical protein LBF27_01310 [Sphingobacterium sp.]|jgi:DNA mismatch repair ATPase MutS|nr:hypothetical protein [Sphingobacterium sp.]
MSFNTDKQTLDDLNIFSRSGQDSIYQLFNKTYTRGGAQLLEELFKSPLSDQQAINDRVAILRFFQHHPTAFPLQGNRFEEAEKYLANTDPRSRLSSQGFSMADFKTAGQSVIALVEILQGLKAFALKLQPQLHGNPYAEHLHQMLELLESPILGAILQETNTAKLPSGKIVEYDNILRFEQRSLMERLLGHIYDLDVYLSVAGVAKARNYCFATAHSGEQQKLHIENLIHPLLKNPVGNSLELSPERHLVFLTGANMAGKSTFMKSLSIAVYLAHLGFPIAADAMEFSVCDGMYTTINLPDNLTIGASHFYAEVLRVKKVAKALGSGQRLFVVFDELFRGTNVKDAYEGTISILEAFAQQAQSLFVISTHIMEAGAVLRERCNTIMFRYLPTTMQDGVPHYTYRLTDGITDDRHGMIIINNEKIIDLINEPKANKKIDRFQADKQTVEDLNLQGKFKQQSIFSLFNQLQTQGGERLLEQMFAQPLHHAAEINARSAIFAFFQQQNKVFPVIRSQIESVQDYLAGGAGASLVRVSLGILHKKVKQTLFHSAELLQLQAGQSVTIEVLQAFRDFFDSLASQPKQDSYRDQITEASNILHHKLLEPVLHASPDAGNFMQLIRNDYIIRHALIKELERLMELIFELDVYMGVARVAATQGFHYAQALPADAMLLTLEGFRHPTLSQGIRNNIQLNRERNMLFLTGANMAGKSTFMKSIGIAVYLAHMGFPVAAERMNFSVKDGLFSSINVSDNLNLGYSHFYAEVLRTKAVAQAVHEAMDLCVLFDELFKGTNVKDAYDATLAVCEAFSRHRNSFFVVSTHIIEVGTALAGYGDNIQFSFLPTIMKEGIPTYPYRLEDGITKDRQGMIIIENEQIVATISGSHTTNESR